MSNKVETLPTSPRQPLAMEDILQSVNRIESMGRRLRVKAQSLDTYLNGMRPIGNSPATSVPGKSGVLPRMFDDLQEIETVLDEVDTILDQATNALPDSARWGSEVAPASADAKTAAIGGMQGGPFR